MEVSMMRSLRNAMIFASNMRFIVLLDASAKMVTTIFKENAADVHIGRLITLLPKIVTVCQGKSLFTGSAGRFVLKIKSELTETVYAGKDIIWLVILA